MKNILVLIAVLSLSVSCASKEHGGQEHGGDEVKEKSGKEHGGKEHGGKEHGGDEVKEKKKKKKKKDSSSLNKHGFRKVSAAEIKTSLTEYIAKNSDANGVFTYTDTDRSDKVMKLKFVKIHDPVRIMPNKGQYFACTDFEVVGADGKLHDLDFWMTPTENGLDIRQTKVHKDPIWKNKTWKKTPRYTFSGEEMVKVN